MKKYNVVEIAKACGVSPSTVCRALNGRSDINKATSEKVLSYCRVHGFSKNMSASSLRIRKSDSIACIMPDLANEMFIDKISCLKEEVLKSGYKWQIFNYGGKEEAQSVFNETAGSRPAGIISSFNPDFEAKTILKNNRIPAVFYDCDVDGFDSVRLDRGKGVLEAVSFMIEKGRRKIILLGSNLESERGRAYSKALLSKGLKTDPKLIVDAPFGSDLFSYGHEQVAKFADNISFDGIMCVNDACAIGVMHALNKKGRGIPENVSVCGFDNIKVAQFTIPSLTTVFQPKEEMAKSAIGFLLKRISNYGAERQTVQLYTSLCIRESV